MNPKIELKLKLVEMLAKGAFNLNADCMPLVKEAYDFVVDGVDFDNDDVMSHGGISEKTAQELNERLAGIVESEKAKRNLLNQLRSNQSFILDDLHEVTLKDGVFLGYTDGHIEMFNGHNDNPDNVEFVAFKFGKVSLKVWGNDIKDVKMTTDSDEPHHEYITRCSVAAHDFDGESHTKDLLERGLKCDYEGFNSGWYIPAIGELYVMYLMKDLLNKALVYTGRASLCNDWYWSSTELSAAYAWRLGFDNGTFSSYIKTNATSVRPVSAFDPLSI